MKVYKNLNPTNKEIKTLIKSAKERIKSAKVLFREKLYRDAISRSYYGVLDIAKAAILTKNKYAKTHSGVLALFSLEFGKTRKIPIELLDFYRKIREAREEADYKTFKEFSKEETKEMIEMAEKFVNYVEKLIK
jgi:uncharacterized protein (UPF0332 family)